MHGSLDKPCASKSWSGSLDNPDQAIHWEAAQSDLIVIRVGVALPQCGVARGVDIYIYIYIYSVLRSQALGLGLLLSGRVPRLDAGECNNINRVYYIYQYI